MLGKRIIDLDKDDVIREVNKSAKVISEAMINAVKDLLVGKKTTLELLAFYLALGKVSGAVTSSLISLNATDEMICKIVHSGLLTLRANVDDQIKKLLEHHPTILENSTFEEFNFNTKEE